MHHGLISDLFNAVLLLKAVAVCKREAHNNHTDFISQGNAKAEAAAKTAAKCSIPETFNMSKLSIPTANLKELQTTMTPDETFAWKKARCVTEGTALMVNHYYAKLTHNIDLVSNVRMYNSISRYWFTKGFNNYLHYYRLTI